MKFTTAYLVRPKENLPENSDILTKVMLDKFATDTNCKTQLLEGKIVFSREKFPYSFWWLFARVTDGKIQITQSESNLLIQGTIYFSNTILIIWVMVVALLVAYLIYKGAPIWFTSLATMTFTMFVIVSNLIFSLISFNSFIRVCIRKVGEITKPR